jgi:hypothetical protein
MDAELWRGIGALATFVAIVFGVIFVIIWRVDGPGMAARVVGATLAIVAIVILLFWVILELWGVL